jgi:hypothetical protein
VDRLFSRVRDALASRQGQSSDVRRLLQEAMRSRTRIELVSLTGGESDGGTIATVIERVREDDVVIDRPAVGGIIRMLGRFEHFTLTFVANIGTVTGETQALGRVRIATEGEAELYGYRLAIPRALHVLDRRRSSRGLLGSSIVEAELHVYSHRGPILGIVEDISPGGARLRCRNAGRHLQPGQRVPFTLTLPAPIGVIMETVTIVGLEPDPALASLTVRISFPRKNQKIADALRADKRPRQVGA